MKICASCKEALPLVSFGPDKQKKDGLRPYCRPCARSKARAYYHKDPDKYRRRQLQTRYGITESEHTALLESQGGLCGICASASALVVDHCHDTSDVRGMLCNKCNTAIGLLGHNLENLKRATEWCDPSIPYVSAKVLRRTDGPEDGVPPAGA